MVFFNRQLWSLYPQISSACLFISVSQVVLWMNLTSHICWMDWQIQYLPACCCSLPDAANPARVFWLYRFVVHQFSSRIHDANIQAWLNLLRAACWFESAARSLLPCTIKSGNARLYSFYYMLMCHFDVVADLLVFIFWEEEAAWILRRCKGRRSRCNFPLWMCCCSMVVGPDGIVLEAP